MSSGNGMIGDISTVPSSPVLEAENDDCSLCANEVILSHLSLLTLSNTDDKYSFI
jgi:hypothetical protein